MIDHCGPTAINTASTPTRELWELARGTPKVLPAGVHTKGSIRYADSFFVVGSFRDDDEHRYFHGSLDQLQVFDDALQSADIFALFSAFPSCTIFDLQCMKTSFGFVHVGGGNCSQKSTSECWYGVPERVLWNVRLIGRTHRASLWGSVRAC